MGQSTPATKAEILEEIERLDKRMISLTNSIASKQRDITIARTVPSYANKVRINSLKGEIARCRAEISNCRTKKATLKARLKQTKE